MENNILDPQPTQDNQKSQKKKSNSIEDWADILESALITVFTVMLIFTYILHPTDVVGTSMVPTLHDQDKIFMTTVIPNLSYGDIIIINNDKSYLLDENNEVVEKESGYLNEIIIKRIIATGGQEIDIDFLSGTVTVDGEILDEPYINDITLIDEGGFDYPVTVPEGYYFVMGDNRNGSTDSRSQYVGFIKQEQIYGKAIFRYFPIKDFGIL